MKVFHFLLCVGCVFTGRSYGESHNTWQFERTGGFVETEVNATADAGVLSDSDTDESLDEILVNSDAVASASDDNGASLSVAMANALNLTPIGATTLLPTVDTTSSSSTIVTSNIQGTFGNPSGSSSGNADSTGDYTLSGNVPWGILTGAGYLVGIAQNTDPIALDATVGGSIGATIEGFSVTASGGTAPGLPVPEWTVDVNLPGASFSYTTSGVNLYFNFAIPIMLPSDIEISAYANGDTSALIPVDSLQSTLSATAWASFAPGTDLDDDGDVDLDDYSILQGLGPNPGPMIGSPPGDLDGDGDIDGDDMLLLQQAGPLPRPPAGDLDGNGVIDGDDLMQWEAGFGQVLGTSLSAGDVDHDGDVDGADFLEWQRNFDPATSLPALGITVPEPSSQCIVILATMGLLPFSRLCSPRSLSLKENR